jgi:hypothetical protein
MPPARMASVQVKQSDYYASIDDYNIDMLMGVQPIGSGYRLSLACLTPDQARAIAKWMQVDELGDRGQFGNAIDDRNVRRHVTLAAERVIAVLAKYLEPGDDPVEVVRGLMISAGWDVP